MWLHHATAETMYPETCRIETIRIDCRPRLGGSVTRQSGASFQARERQAGMKTTANGATGGKRLVSGLVTMLLCVVAGSATFSSAAIASPLAWSTPRVIDAPAFETGAEIVGMSCPTSGLCAAIDVNETSGHILTSTGPASPSTSWQIADMGEFDYPRAVSCASESFCAVADDRGNVLVSTEPTGGIAAWTKVPLDAEAVENETSFNFLDVSCPSASFCAAIDDIGNVFTSTDPTGGIEAWTSTPLGDTSLEAISCASAALCVITDFHGNILTSTEPTAGAAAWHSAHLDESGLGGVSCPSTSLCVIGGFFGEIFSSTEPAAGPEAWSSADFDESGYLLSVSCPLISFCAAVDSFEGNALTSQDPFHVWTRQHLSAPEGLFAISCPSAELCVVGGTNGSVVVGTPEEESEEGEGEEEGSPGSGGGNPPAGGSPSPNPAPAPTLPPVPVRHKKPLHCRKGFKKQRIHGKTKCVKVKQKGRK